MKLLFAHGWGFDSGFWVPLAGLLPQWPHAIDDRGYFGRSVALAPAEPCLAVTHSFGTLRVLADPPPGLAGIVAINGFAWFTSPTGVPRRVVDRMLRRFDEDARGVLADFRRTCGCKTPFGPVEAEPLRADLLRLRDEAAPPPRVPVFCLRGGHDPILPATMRAGEFAQSAAWRREHPAAGHLLPLEDPAFCERAVRDAAAALA